VPALIVTSCANDVQIAILDNAKERIIFFIKCVFFALITPGYLDKTSDEII
jgi:hypothetical protein